ncbi:MAG TPA: UDP-N-acetylmuramoyl-L-alanine--D-glutamate ligase [Acidothermaceae bacterium]|jgi:UDP-N-acetylmuramoylalanine--D-glutamate ligase
MAVVIPSWLPAAGHDAPWHELTVCVAGVGVSGVACARVLRALGAQVTAVDAGADERERQTAIDLHALGVEVRLDDGDTLPTAAQLVVTSPGWRRESPLFVAAAAAGLPVWGEPELAWRLRKPGAPAWLVVTGTDGKTTATLMLASILRAAGQRTTTAGNIGTALVEVVNGPYDVLAVELGSFQLHWSRSVAPTAAAILNVAPDHLDWWGDSYEDYVAAKGLAFAHAETCAIGNADDPVSTRLLARAPGRRVAFTLNSPRPHQLGVVEDLLVDRAFVDDADNMAIEIATLADVIVPGLHNVANALAAAALARAYGVDPGAIAEGLRTFTPAPHRIAEVAVIHGVRFVDDSKATSPHAAAAALTSFDSIVWIAGGLGKGIAFDDVVRMAAPRLRAVVLIGACRAEIADALARHAPDVHVVEVATPETNQVEVVMDRVVAQAVELATAGDTVLLAPAAASMDMFRDYGHRGDVFAAAVRRLQERAR